MKRILRPVADEKKITKKKTKTKGTSGRATAPASQRYTPPVPVHVKSSSRWVAIFMFGFFALGVGIILLNYLPGAPGLGWVGEKIGLPNDTSNTYLLIGIGFIGAGFIAATRYR